LSGTSRSGGKTKKESRRDRRKRRGWAATSGFKGWIERELYGKTVRKNEKDWNHVNKGDGGPRNRRTMDGRPENSTELPKANQLLGGRKKYKPAEEASEGNRVKKRVGKTVGGTGETQPSV